MIRKRRIKMTYQCPKCGRYGMEWDGRAKVLLCYYNTCNHVIRIGNQKNVPNSETILEAIKKDLPQNPITVVS
jgi:hypothetical protein